ncbi:MULTISPECIES: hypothetical protein [unclassified Burkholderia]|uniref:hypothetical protein n=1 Tax=unclassified Burkholderia TaxID=2613784 RepID=UPI00141F2FBD|nr:MULTISPECIES: hypothetical protein [unclassified Burkholderia]NIE55537.1 hypothetical protein [Burkholderia sp. Ap-955]NIF08715.1 hypothetical protein [Burkholderia sp. Ax-1735]NIG02337.1 hypothetical protein [Burkholderia sp. Tr-849]
MIAATALGGALYAAQSSRDAAATLNSNQSSHGSDNASGGSSPHHSASSDTSSYSDASTSPSYSAPAHGAAPPVAGQQSSSNDRFLLGYLLGRSSSPRETVVVQQPMTRSVDSTSAPRYRRAPDDDAVPDAASDAQAETLAQSPATTEKQPTGESKHPIMNAFLLGGMLFLSICLVIGLFQRARRAWLLRKARYASHTNYRL